jgi:hypothetical protein
VCNVDFDVAAVSKRVIIAPHLHGGVGVPVRAQPFERYVLRLAFFSQFFVLRIHFDFPVVVGCGPLAGAVVGLEALGAGDFDHHNFFTVHNCVLPFHFKFASRFCFVVCVKLRRV